MLPLDSPRWSELDTFFVQGEKVPTILREWVDAVGFDQEMTIYLRDLFNLYLHQGTITNVAFAVVPWIVAHCSRAETCNRVQYLSDVALVELRRLTCGLHSVREGGDPDPAWLMDDYTEAIRQAQSMAEDTLDEPLDGELRKTLWEHVPALFGKIELAPKRLYRSDD